MGDSSRTRLSADEIWAAWRRVARALSARGLLWETFVSRSVWTQWGVDHVSGLRRNRSSRQVFDILAPLSREDLRRIHLIATINHRRLEAISRWIAIGFVTLPASAALTLAQLAPEVLERLELGRRDLPSVAFILLVVVYYLVSAWRARQIVTVVEFAFVERDEDVSPSQEELILDL